MSALSLCDGTANSPCWSECSGLRLAAAPRVGRGAAVSCRWKRPGTLCLLRAKSPSLRRHSRKVQWAIRTMSDNSGDQSGNSTRLFSAIRSFWSMLSAKLKKARKGLPVKILFFLIGFYCATAFATVIGQTVLGRMRNMITIFNYWKAGLTLGLFLDSFKYEVDEFLESGMDAYGL
ncbi:ycf20-like protein isoform X3 [Miscanthus floridulus]|uniref:ycf20-like protein isoform X3 n=1 Tax=Miscanthus floridulus TaxID=154761 RepID=UPI0034596FBE